MALKKTVFFAIACFVSLDVYGGTSPTFESAPSYDNVLVVYNAAYTIDSDADSVQDSQQISSYFAIHEHL